MPLSSTKRVGFATVKSGSRGYFSSDGFVTCAVAGAGTPTVNNAAAAAADKPMPTNPARMSGTS